ncbi:MAG TPA: putative Ig domain-containing protein [Thermoanaerobaculia bacterium]|nr:putative Ig domain-containing protein [Thermoanaerobaculia bacterium]
MKKIILASSLAIAVIGLASRGSALPPPSLSVASESGSVMYTDIGNTLDATYLVFQITNSGGPASDVWAQLDTSASSIISNVGTGVHELKFKPATGAHGTAPTPETGLAGGETKGVFFLVKATQTTSTPQTLTVKLFSTCSDTSTPGCGSGTLSGSLGSQSFAFTVADTIQANANKVNTVITIPSNPQIGQLGTITVDGCTGTVGAAKVLYFSPVSSHSWPADSFEFIDADIDINGYANTPYRNVALIPSADVLTNATCSQNGSGTGSYDEIFTFVIDGQGTASTTPANFISSGTQVKHTTNASGSFSVVIPPPTCPTITVSSTPATLLNATVGVPYSASFSASPPAQGTYSFTASGLPAWLSLDSSTGALTGTPGFGDVGTVSFTVTATDSGGDPAGCTGQTQFTFDVVCAHIDVHSVPSCCPYPAATVGQLYTIHFSASPSGTYTFSGFNFPSWLSIDPSTGILSGTPGTGDVGVVDIGVTATETTSQCQGGLEVEFNVDPAAPKVPTLGGVGLAVLALSLAASAYSLIRRG